MRDLYALTLVCNHHNLRTFIWRATSHHNTSALRSVFVCMARVWKTYVCGTGACVWYPRVSGTWVRSPVCARHDPRKCKNETSREKCYSCVVACCMLPVCSRMYSYLLVYYSYVLVWCFSHDWKAQQFIMKP